MGRDMNKRRRQVAWVCFEPYLSKDQLLEAIQILEQDFQFDSVSNIIAFVSRICSDFNIDVGIRKALYGRFHEKMEQESDLPIDPLTLLNGDWQPADSAIVPTPVPGSHQNEPDSAAIEIANIPPTIAAIVDSAPVSGIPQDANSFAYFIGQLLDYMPNKSDFFEALGELATNQKFSNRGIELQVNNWLSDVGNFMWSENLPEQNLEEIVRLIYHALSDIVGSANADEIFHQAITKCEPFPLAKQFSPARFQ